MPLHAQVEADDWLAESAAFAPQTSDYTKLRDLEDAFREYGLGAGNPSQDLESVRFLWEGFILDQRLWLVLEQASDDCGLLCGSDRAERLASCPAALLGQFRTFLNGCPADLQHYLARRFYCLVRASRSRRTGAEEWLRPIVSGSDPVLRSLMFKWGPRFSRHRYSW